MPMQPNDVSRTWTDTKRLNDLGYQSTISIKEVGKNLWRGFLLKIIKCLK